MKDFGFTDAEYQTFANLTALLAEIQDEIAGENFRFDQYRALVEIDPESRKHAAKVLKNDAGVTHDEILAISEMLARKGLTQGQRAFEKSRQAFDHAFADRNRAAENSFRQMATRLFDMMQAYSIQSSDGNSTKERRSKVSRSGRLLAEIIATSGELLTLFKALFPDSAAPMKEWAKIAYQSPTKAYLAQADYSLEVMSDLDFNGEMPGEWTGDYGWSSLDAIRFLAELAPSDYNFGLKEEIDPRDVRKLDAIDLCASGGGQALGIEAAGYYVHGLVDRDTDSIQTLKLNRRRWNAIEADLAAPLSSAEINGWRGTKKRAADLDLVSASLPIAPWAYNELREGELFTPATSIIETLNPKAFFFEAGLAFDAPRNADFRQDLIAHFASLGYKTRKWRLNAKEFGVPQDRTRMYLVGIKKELGDLRPPMRSKTTTVGPAVWTEAFPYLSDFGAYRVKQVLFEDETFEVVEEPQDRSEDQLAYDIWALTWAHRFGGQVAPDMDRHRVQPRGSSAHLWRNAGFDPQMTELPRPGDGVLRRYYGYLQQGRDHLPLLPMSVSLLSRLQGMPEDWYFSGDDWSARQQVCSTRPPLVSLAIAREIHRAITGQTVDLDHPAAWEITNGETRFVPFSSAVGGVNNPDPLWNRARRWAEEQDERERALLAERFDDVLGDE
ncbi:DNA cytosine methyltransferase [Rhizobium leguminosarum]|uniref:DNA cytosine methyltransferase n=1 Tax=Rhizobium leguminosarum TaxID=384 RepID=UPI0013EE62BA|nr:DNA cytosine methyltransferase [Rhizobium leguminosarum]